MIINKKNFLKSGNSYYSNKPFNHFIIDDFFNIRIAKKLEKQFPDYNSKIWQGYNNPIEVKKVCNNWNLFPAETYKAISYLNSKEFVGLIEKKLFKKNYLFTDVGLNGGGWHIHKKGGKLNTHLDYSIHPKLGLQRKLNLIIYLNSNWKSTWGGFLGLWGNETSQKPGKLIKSIEPKFNRAIIFDTTQNSWHGLPEPITCPKNQFRKSIAIYYLCEKSKKISKRGKALFSPTNEQKNDKKIIELINRRASTRNAKSVYHFKIK